MKGAIEKIIEKLEEYRDKNLVEHDSEQSQHCRDVGDCGMLDCALCVFDKAIEILKQEAEQYNNGWISCSERMPEVPEEIDDDECPEFNVAIKGADQATTLKCASDGTWFDDLGYTYDVIAWQPLSEPYQPSGNRKKRTNFDRCCESMETMAQIIDIAKIGWTKDQIMEWLQKEECEVSE